MTDEMQRAHLEPRRECGELLHDFRHRCADGGVLERACVAIEVGSDAPAQQRRFHAVEPQAVDEDDTAVLRAHFGGGVRTRMWSSRSCCSLTSVGASVSGSAAVCVLGKAITSRMLSAPAISIAIRSRPKAIPPCGGQPNLSASSRNPNLTRASSGPMPR